MIFDVSGAGATLLLLSLAIVTPVTSMAYEFVKCPDLEGNMINYPEGTICVGDDDNEEEENE